MPCEVFIHTQRICNAPYKSDSRVQNEGYGGSRNGGRQAVIFTVQTDGAECTGVDCGQRARGLREDTHVCTGRPLVP